MALVCVGLGSEYVAASPSLQRKAPVPRAVKRKKPKRRGWMRPPRCRWSAKAKGRRSRVCTKYRKGKVAETYLLVSANKQRMYLCRDGRLLRSYRIGYGRRGWGKRKEGDKKTPLGTYKITWMAARHEPRRTSVLEYKLQRFQIRDKGAYCKHNYKINHSEFNRKNGPRDERLWRRPYGGKRAVSMAINYPNKQDIKKGLTGSCIQIHASYHLRGSAGCITLYPRYAREVYDCLKPETRIEIRRKL